MLKVFWSVGWRAVLIGVPIYIGWLTFFAPAVRSAHSLSEATSSLQPFLETKTLQQRLTDLDLRDLKPQDRRSVEFYYQNARAAKKEAGQDLALTKKKLSLSLFPLRDQTFYHSVQKEVEDTNSLLASLTPTYQNLAGLFNYYEASSLALYNLFYYDPNFALKTYQASRDYKTFLQLFGQTSNGLEKTVHELNKLPAYPDPTLASFRGPIQDLAAQAKKISDLASADPAGAYLQGQDFAVKVDSLQNRLLADRQSFWGSLAERKKLLAELNLVQNKASQQLSALVGKLNELKRH